MPHLYSDLEKIIKNPLKRETTVHLPDDYQKDAPIIYFPNAKSFDGFKDDKDIPLCNIED